MYLIVSQANYAMIVSSIHVTQRKNPMLEKLRAHDLSKLGYWVKSNHATVSHLRTECPFGINYDIPKDWQTKRNVIYAFVINSQVCYVGETTAGMASRFNGYRYGNPLKTDTDNRVKLAITQALMRGEEVAIWAGQPFARLTLKDGTDLSIPASKPLEELLIKRVKPKLNKKVIGEENPV